MRNILNERCSLSNEQLPHRETNSSSVEMCWFVPDYFFSLICTYSNFLTLHRNHPELFSSWKHLLSYASIFAPPLLRVALPAPPITTSL